MKLKFNKFDLTISAVIVVASVVFFYLYSNMSSYNTQYIGQEFQPAEVITISGTETQSSVLSDGSSYGEILVTTFVARITSGELEGETVTALQYYDSYLYETLRPVEVGDKIILSKTTSGDVMADTWYFSNIDRTSGIIIAILLFFAVVLLIGRGKGIAAIISLLFTIAAIFIVYVPSILHGYNIYLVTAGIAVYLVIMSLLLLNGANNKTYCAIAGNIIGLIVAAVLGIAVSNIFMISGVVSNEHITLAYYGKDVGFSMHEIIWSGMVIGALGAIMDVSMSLSSAMKELSDNMEKPTVFGLIKSGLNIGHDIIGTMLNTLVLAYIGSSIVSVLLLTIFNDNLLTIFNSELVLVEIMQALVGSTGILLTVPFTVVVCSYVFTRKPKDNNSYQINSDDYLFDIKAPGTEEKSKD